MARSVEGLIYVLRRSDPPRPRVCIMNIRTLPRICCSCQLSEGSFKWPLCSFPHRRRKRGDQGAGRPPIILERGAAYPLAPSPIIQFKYVPIILFEGISKSKLFNNFAILSVFNVRNVIIWHWLGAGAPISLQPAKSLASPPSPHPSIQHTHIHSIDYTMKFDLSRIIILRFKTETKMGNFSICYLCFAEKVVGILLFHGSQKCVRGCACRELCSRVEFACYAGVVGSTLFGTINISNLVNQDTVPTHRRVCTLPL